MEKIFCWKQQEEELGCDSCQNSAPIEEEKVHVLRVSLFGEILHKKQKSILRLECENFAKFLSAVLIKIYSLPPILQEEEFFFLVGGSYPI